MDIRRWAEQYRPARSSEPLLDGDVTWTLPADFPTRNIDLEGVVVPLIEIGNEWAKLVV